MKPAVLAWIVTALFAIGVSASVFRIPIQISDSVEILEVVEREPSVSPPPVAPAEARLTPRLRDEALHRGRTNPFLLWPPYARLWGEN